jgi:hypothetical protein
MIENDSQRALEVARNPMRLGFRGRLAKTESFVARLKLSALGEKLDAFEALEHVAFSGNGTGPFEAAVLGHIYKFG